MRSACSQINMVHISSNSIMQEQQQTHYYDKLLHHLNRTFITNMKAQELYLDLVKHSRRIRFRSIKNIYTTLTEGKADEVLYGKDKPQIINQHIFNQKYSQRISWRLIEKLVTKISYYLVNERRLTDLAPHIMRVIQFTKNVSDKVTSRSIFTQFFADVVDSIILENNLLEEKIYDLLIKRGYIYSIDEFYRMNRFEGPNIDFVYSSENQRSQDGSRDETIEQEFLLRNGSYKRMSKLSRRGLISFKTMKMSEMDKNNRINEEEESDDSMEEDDVDVEGNAESADSETADEPSGDKEMKPQILNKLIHNIHEQVDKIAEELLNNQNLQSLVSAASHADQADYNQERGKEPIIKQLLKNIKLRNYKANEKILTINKNDINNLQEKQRKNSTKGMVLSKKNEIKNMILTMNKNRTSIATALSKRMKENVFQNQHLADLESIVHNKLGKLESTVSSEKAIFRKNIVRSNGRQHTQNLQSGQNSPKTQPFVRRASNLQFLTNAFVFNNRAINMRIPIASNPKHHRMSNFAPQINMSEVSSYQSIQSCVNSLSKNNINRYNEDMVQEEKELTNISSRFAQQKGGKMQKKAYQQFRVKTGQFNPLMIELAARKYNKCVTESTDARQNLKELDIFGEGVFGHETQTPDQRNFSSEKHNIDPYSSYQHTKRYEIFDRVRRKLL